jgi:hypothetical protein
MANSNINLINLDFDTLKNNFKTYLKSQDKFKDYDFDGSNMSVLLDVMTYNTYLNSFYTNMVASEMFLDTAQIRDSVVSHAKELNYLPRSFKSAEAVVDVTINTGSPSVTSVVIPKGTTFSSRIGSNSFSFSTNRNIVVAGSNGIFTAANVSIYEGEYVNESFVVDYTQTTQRFVISNPTVDTDSISVTVLEDNGATAYEYSYATSLLGLTSESKVFFVQAAENEKYEIVFGDGIVSRRPKDGASVIVDYRVTNGELPNGAFKFTTDGPIESYSNVRITTVSAAIGGAVNETVESIRFNAPRHYTTQERAITPSDYETLLKTNYPEINAVSAYGGEEESPPQYGRVFLSVDIKDVEGLPTVKVNEYYRFLKDRSPVSIEPVFKNPGFTYIDVKSTVNYDISKTNLEPSDIETLVISAILSFNTANINNFKKTLRYSRLLDAIDGAHPSIISNETSVRAIKVVTPVTGRAQNLTVKYDFPLLNDKQQRINQTHSSNVKRTIESSIFTLRGRNVIVEDDGNGKLVLAGLSDNNTYTIIKDIGTVDYGLGLLSINDLTVTTYSGLGIKFYARPASNDIYSTKNNILTIKIEDIDVNAIRTKYSPDTLVSSGQATVIIDEI